MPRAVTGTRRKVKGFGGFLFGKRQQHGRAQAWIAQAIGMSSQSISEYERSDWVFTEEQLRLLAEALGEDPLPWLQAGGYQPPPEAVSSGPPAIYGSKEAAALASNGAAPSPAPAAVEVRAENVIEIITRTLIDRRTGKVLESTTNALLPRQVYKDGAKKRT